jgi:kynurenine 3-monooxygenase
VSAALIVGGGLAGSVLAIVLARRGQTVEVFERLPDARKVYGGKHAPLNITLCPRGLRVLAAIGASDRVSALSVPVYGRQIHNADGSVSYQAYGSKGEALYSIARIDLNGALLDLAEREAGVRLRFEQKCVQVDLERSTAAFQDARTDALGEVRAERIFGADGAYSTVRQHLQRTHQFNYSQSYLTKGYTTLKISPPGAGSPALKPDVLHVWPRGNCLWTAFPNRDKSFTCPLLLPYHGDDSYESLSTEGEVASLFSRLFPEALALIPDLARQFFARPPDSLLTIRCDPWSYGDKTLLLGDSAHAILPSYGQGANAAFEDCAALDQCLDECGAEWGAAFKEFEQRRRPSMDAMADLCVEHFRELSELIGDAAFRDRRAMERRIHELYPDLYEPLYSMVTFGSKSYAEAVRIERRQRAALDRLVSWNIDVERPEARAMLENFAREAR